MIDIAGLFLSRPLTNGTIQKEHILLQPRIIEIQAWSSPDFLTGKMSAYVSSKLSYTFIAWASSCPIIASKFGRSLYASGPATRSTTLWSSIFSLTRSAIHPNTPILVLLCIFKALYLVVNLFQIFYSAPSLIAHVFTNSTSHSCIVSAWV